MHPFKPLRSSPSVLQHAGEQSATENQPSWICEDRDRLANAWEMYGPKSGRIVRVIGDLRYYFWLLLEGDPSVTEICEQPLRLTGAAADDRCPGGTFDFWCRLADGNEVYLDVHYTSHLRNPARAAGLQPAMDLKAAWAQHRNAGYAVATDTWLAPARHEIANWSIMLPYLRPTFTGLLGDLPERVVRCVSLHPGATLGEIHAAIGTTDVELLHAATFRLIHNGRLTANLASQPIGSGTTLHCGGVA